MVSEAAGSPEEDVALAAGCGRTQDGLQADEAKEWEGMGENVLDTPTRAAEDEIRGGISHFQTLEVRGALDWTKSVIIWG
jgi:hypothetical protein